MSSPPVDVEFGARSHPGKVRPNNEDHYLVTRFDRSMTTLLTNVPPGTVPERHVDEAFGLLVADGMGGAAAGEVASSTAIGTLVQLAIQTPDWIMNLDDGHAGQVLDRMRQRFEKLSSALEERAAADPKLVGMGTTMTLVLSLRSDAIVVHIGDSRAYLRRDGALHRLTRDQTMAQSLADAGAITSQELARHPLRHMLTGAISTKGARGTVELQHVPLAGGDQILLCSDGLTDMISDAEIDEALAGPGNAQDACDRLVDRALAAGGKDNVTVVVAAYRIPPAGG